MAPLRFLFSVLATFFSFTAAIPLETRQDESLDVAYYTAQVSAALAAIDSIRRDKASNACSYIDYAEEYGQLAQTLVCEEAAGIHIFPNIEEAEQAFFRVYKALVGVSWSDPPLACQEFDVPVDALDNAGLDGPAIRDVICANPSTVSLPSSPALVGMSTTQSSAGSSTADSFPTSLQVSDPGDDCDNPRGLCVPSSSSTRGGSFCIGSTCTGFTSSLFVSTPGFTFSASATPSSTSNPAAVTVVVVTTFTTVTVTPAPSSPNDDDNANAAQTLPQLPPLRFTLASRVAAEEPAITSLTDAKSSSDSIIWTWTIGPPVSASFPTPDLVNGTAVWTGLAPVTGSRGQTTSCLK